MRVSIDFVHMLVYFNYHHIETERKFIIPRKGIFTASTVNKNACSLLLSITHTYISSKYTHLQKKLLLPEENVELQSEGKEKFPGTINDTTFRLIFVMLHIPK